MTNRNHIRIAKQLVKLAKMLIATEKSYEFLVSGKHKSTWLDAPSDTGWHTYPDDTYPSSDLKRRKIQIPYDIKQDVESLGGNASMDDIITRYFTRHKDCFPYGMVSFLHGSYDCGFKKEEMDNHFQINKFSVISNIAAKEVAIHLVFDVYSQGAPHADSFDITYELDDRGLASLSNDISLALNDIKR